jgi:DNA repair exonuclease SbcCD ATPase subunit
MSDLATHGEITSRDLARLRNLKIAAVASPIALAGVPAVLFLALTILFGTTPPIAATFVFLGLILTIIGFIGGLALTGFFAYRHANWTRELRERIAARGIRAEEIDWFRHELKTSEKQSLRLVSARDPLLGDAFKETLASRLTASRIVRSSKRELLMMQKHRNKLKYNRSESSQKFQSELDADIDKIRSINDEAKQMLAEAEARMQMIEAASVRGTSIADNELALKKLSNRASELPLALESARMTEEIRRELEEDDVAVEPNEPQ